LVVVVEEEVEAEQRSLDKHSSCIAEALRVGFDECTGTHYALAVEPVGIAHCCKSTLYIVDTFDEEDVSAADVDCLHDNIAMLAEEVDKEILDHSSSDQLTLSKRMETLVVVEEEVVCRTSSINIMVGTFDAVVLAAGCLILMF
jgi:hypothetical protein